MEHATGREYSSIIQDLIKEGAGYDFFQAVWLLEESLKKRNKSDFPQQLHLSPSSGLSFPATDIKTCYMNANDEIHLQLNFMGLYGVDSPLPHYFMIYAAQEDEVSKQLKSFLDILNHRIYHLLYLAWKKYQVYLQLDNEDSSYLKYLCALSGNSCNISDINEFAYAGLFGSRVHNSTGLKNFISEYLGGAFVSIQQFMPRWINLEQVLCLKTNNIICLGENTILGQRVIDLSGKIKIQIGPITLEQAINLLPGRTRGCQLGQLMKRYLGPTLEFELIFLVLVNSLKILQLGIDEISLGWVCCLGQTASEVSCWRFHGNLLSFLSYSDG